MTRQESFEMPMEEFLETLNPEELKKELISKPSFVDDYSTRHDLLSSYGEHTQIRATIRPYVQGKMALANLRGDFEYET